MQLVLGAQNRLDLGSAGDPVPLRPERWRLGERGWRWLRRAAWSSAFVVLVALGVLQGARVAIGAAGVSELAQGADALPNLSAPAAPPQQTLSGAFWRPAGSSAERPQPELAPQRWKPKPRK